jgi:anhydro-N-acetylmuramic acid kinase
MALPPPSPLFIGLMSGTSLDGVDGILASFFSREDGSLATQTKAAAYLPFPSELRAELLALQVATPNELHREALAANALSDIYADCVTHLLQQANLTAMDVVAIGAHGQTIRHRPECAYTWQCLNPARLAELTSIDVVADFRSRDIAAGGQGAPLVPPFHQAVFGSNTEVRVVANIGGIGNISILHPDGTTLGFDTGPGNLLLDGWIHRHGRMSYDEDGRWAAGGRIHTSLLDALRREPYFALPPPKSTGRDLFHLEWLDRKLEQFPKVAPQDVQSTLAAFTATTLADAILTHAPTLSALHVCGGGAYNSFLMQQLEQSLTANGNKVAVTATDVLGVPPNQVESLAFGWLAWRFTQREPGNSPKVTGARGPRILGALYPA